MRLIIIVMNSSNNQSIWESSKQALGTRVAVEQITLFYRVRCSALLVCRES